MKRVTALLVGFIFLQIFLFTFILSRQKTKVIQNKLKQNSTFEPIFIAGGPKSNIEDRYVKFDLCLSDNLQVQEKQVEKALKKCPYADSNGLFEESTKDGYTIDFTIMFDILMEFIKCGIPFAFTRWGDGEFDLIQGHKIRKNEQAFLRDRFSWEGGESKLGIELRKALGAKGNYFYGFPCPDVWKDKLIGFLSFPEMKQPMKYISYSWMTVN